MVTVINLFKSTFYRLFAGILAILMTLSNGVNSFFNGNIYPYDSNSKVIGLETFERAQGVTTDGKAWYFSGKNSLVKISFDNETVLACNYDAITDELENTYGSKHIGGISYFNGYVYAPLEDSKKWQHPVVALYDAETLEFSGICHEFSNEILSRGMSWVCVDGEKGLLYSSHSKTADVIYCFDLQTFDYVKSIKLSEEIDNIQGGEVYNGTLYVGTNDSTRAAYAINTDNGNVEKLFDRIMYVPKWIDNFGGEGEDLTVFPMDDGTLVHALDIGALFIDANLRHYKLEK